MKQKEAVRDYLFPDSSLIQKCDDVLNSVARDSVEFDKRGYNEQKRDAFSTLRENFADLPLDSSLEGIKVSATQRKDQLRDSLETKMRTVFALFKNKFSTESGQYKELGESNISRLKDDALCRNAREMVKIAIKYKPDLSGDGLTDELIAELVDVNKSFDDAIDEQIAAVKNRDVGAYNRIKTGNALYKELLSVCTLGKDIWYSANEAKYNDFIIYNTPSGKKEDTPPAEPGV